jgi:hypothetical protein
VQGRVQSLPGYSSKFIGVELEALAGSFRIDTINVKIYSKFCVSISKKKVSRIHKKTLYLQLCIRFIDATVHLQIMKKIIRAQKSMFQANSTWSSSTQNPK